MSKSWLTQAPSPRGISLLPRDLIKALTIHLPGIPLMNNLHLKAKLSFPDRFFLLYCSSVTSREKKPRTNKPSNPGLIYLPPTPIRKGFKKISHPAHCSVSSSDTNDSGRNPAASQTRDAFATCKRSLEFTRAPQSPLKQLPPDPQLKPALQAESRASPRKAATASCPKSPEFCQRN